MNTQLIAELRSEERIPVSLPMSVANIEGITRDISLTGICFEAVGDFRLGEVVRIVVEFGNLGGNLTLNCCGEIVRLVDRRDKVKVSVKISESVLEPA